MKKQSNHTGVSGKHAGSEINGYWVYQLTQNSQAFHNPIIINDN
jgi:hypothetical protein